MFDDIRYRASRQARQIGRKAAIGTIAAIFAIAGLGYAADAAWRYLALAYDPVVASAILALVLLSVSLLLVVLLKSGGSNEPPAPPPQPEPRGMNDAEYIALLLRSFSAGKDTGRRMGGR